MDFQKELKKFQPCLEVEKIKEKDINTDEIKDLLDILKTIDKKKGGS